ncbi:MAG: hypothetical protein JNL63_12105 [Bacteroidia bacterium]|nr:hypothetical protein [Bacteroidia bacterium]
MGDYEKANIYVQKAYNNTVSQIDFSYKTSCSADSRKNLLRSFVVVSSNSIMSLIYLEQIQNLDSQFTLFLQFENKMAIDTDLNTFYTHRKYSNYFLIAGAKITRTGITSPDFTTWVKQFYSLEKKFPRRIAFFCYDSIALYYLINGSFNECQSAISCILNDKNVYKQFPDTYSSALIYQLFLNFETDDFDILESNTKKAERYFENYFPLPKYQKYILEFFDKIRIVTGRKKQSHLMIEFQNKIKLVKKSSDNSDTPYHQQIIFIDFDCWLESKITNRSFIEIKKEKAKTNPPFKHQ